MQYIKKYALECGLQIGSQFLLEKFFPLGFTDYITIQGGSSMPSKNYPFFSEVARLLHPYLSVHGIQIVQLGAENEPPIIYAHQLQGKTEIGHVEHILRNAKLHLGNDSWMIHRAGELGLPLVALYGSTTPENHGPYRYNKEKTIFLSGDREGKMASFSANEFPPTIATITPESVANAVLSLLGLPTNDVTHSVFCGFDYQNQKIEVYPDVCLKSSFASGTIPNIRMDYRHDENFLWQNLSQRKCQITINNPISDINRLTSFKANISEIRCYVSPVFTVEHIQQLKESSIPVVLIAKNQDYEVLRKMRLDFFDHGLIEEERIKTIDNVKSRSHGILFDKNIDISANIDNLFYRSGKFLLSSKGLFLSYAGFIKNLPAPSFEDNWQKVIDDKLFWEESENFYIYKQS